MTVVSLTDQMVERQFGREAVLALTEARLARELDEELTIRTRRVKELTRSAVVWTKPTTTPAPPRPAGKPTAVWRKPCAPESSFPWEVVLDEDAKPRFELRLDGDVCHQITEWIRDVGFVIETGGMLFGHERLRSTGGVACWGTGPGPNSRHGPSAVWLSTEQDIRENFPDWLRSEDFRRLGDWHTHPSGSGRPSQVDLDAWASYLYEHRRSCLHESVSLIVTPDPQGGIPRFHGWHMRRSLSGHYVVRPAKLVDRHGYTDQN